MIFKRIFIGLPISEMLAQNILAWEKDKAGKISWIKPENLHITILPPMKLLESEIPDIIAKLTRLSNFSNCFDLDFYSIETISRNGKPRYIWLEGGRPHELLQLRNSLLDCMDFPEPQEYKTHLTLARLSAQNSDINLNQDVDWHEQIRKFNLYESVPGKGQQDYMVLKSFRLAAK